MGLHDSLSRMFVKVFKVFLPDYDGCLVFGRFLFFGGTGSAEDRLPPSHKMRQETSSETSLYDTQKVHSFTSQELELQVHERHVL